MVIAIIILTEDFIQSFSKIVVPLTLMRRISSSIDLLISTIQIAVKYNEFNSSSSKSVKKLSKSLKIIKKFEKLQRAEKL